MSTAQSPTHTHYERAMNADPQLRALADLVTALCQFVRPADTMCGGCAWDSLVKPLATPLIGWQRGYPPETARDPEPNRPWRLIIGRDLTTEWEAAKRDRKPATTDTEAWLRTSEAWDGYCGELIQRLNDADPAHGHGICRYGRPASLSREAS
ncbi:hypothetical protein ABZ235_33945 [Streptomyces canus]|uniref:hypothetical protein n=1 Tax=Streptomyces canus TaxID=58343 RepID=UPI0033AE5E5B